MNRGAVWAILALAGLTVVAAAGIVLTTPGPVGTPLRVWVLVGLLPMLLVGGLAFSMRPDHNVARLLLAAAGFLTLQTGLTGAATRFLEQADARWWVGAAPLLQLVGLTAAVSVGALFVVFPDGRSRTPMERGALRGFVVLVVAVPILLALGCPFLTFGPTILPVSTTISNPVFVPWISPLGAIAREVYLQRVLIPFVGAALLAARYRRSHREDQLRIRWLLLAAGVAALDAFLFVVFGRLGLLPKLRPLIFYGLLVPSRLLIAGSVLIGLFRHRLLDVEPWIWRSVLYGSLVFVIGLAYVSMTAVLGLAAGYQDPAWAAVAVTLLAALAFQPLRRRLERWARGRVFGRRLSGHELLTRFGQTLQGAYEIPELGAHLASTVVEGLELRWAGISLQADSALGGHAERIGTVGVEPDAAAEAVLVVPLIHAGQTIGVIECGPKRRGTLSAVDRELLETVASQAALAIHNARLAAMLEARLQLIEHQAAELTASRTRIVQAQDAERRRIERNIHDGVQQHLVVLMAKLRLARNQMVRDPQVADHALAEFQEDARRMLADLRDLSSGIHPTVLTDRGVVEALEAKVPQMPIDVSIEVDPGVRTTRYAEEIEAAAYFLISEGLTNVFKHSGAGAARIHLGAANGRLVVEVADRGRGIPANRAGGTGLVGLRDRIEAVGGTLEITSEPGAGTTLRGTLPAREARPANA